MSQIRDPESFESSKHAIAPAADATAPQIAEQAHGNGTSRRRSPRAKRWLRIAQWIVIPIAIVGIVELALRDQLRKHPFFWDRVIATAGDRQPLDILCLGSSRVAAAIDEAKFAEIMSADQGRPVKVINAGQGYSTQYELTLGLRNMVRKNPDALRGTVVFMEAPGGMPIFEGNDEPRFEPDRPDLLRDMLSAEDIPAIWRSSLNASDKVKILCGYATRDIRIIADGRRIMAEKFIQARNGFTRRAAKFISWIQPAVVGDKDGTSPADLIRAGGTRVDAEGVRNSRELALRAINDELIQQQTPYPDWQLSRAAEIVALVQEHGGRVVFFEMPIHSLRSRRMQTPVRQQDRDRFERLAERWGCPILSPQFKVVDDDFPDFWHLAGSRRAEFTQALAASYIRGND